MSLLPQTPLGVGDDSDDEALKTMGFSMSVKAEASPATKTPTSKPKKATGNSPAAVSSSDGAGQQLALIEAPIADGIPQWTENLLGLPLIDK